MFAWLTPCPRLCWEYEVLPARSEAMIYACDDPVDGAMAGSLILFRQLLRDLGQGHLNFDDAAVVGRGHREWSLSCGIRACILDLRACILDLRACILDLRACILNLRACIHANRRPAKGVMVRA